MPRRESAAARRARRRIARGVARFTPSMTSAIERGWRAIRESLTVREITRAIEVAGGRSDAFVSSLFSDASLNRALGPARATLVTSLESATLGFLGDLPNAIAATASFNILDPAVTDAVRALDLRAFATMRHDIRETARQGVEAGIKAGLGSTTIARGLRDDIGLAPSQHRAVENFRRTLEEGRPGAALRYTLRDRRFDSRVRNMRDTPLTRAQITTMTDRYRSRFIKHNAETHASTILLNSQKLGSHLATTEAIEAGVLPAELMRSRWSSAGDDRVRELHVSMDGAVVQFGQPFETGDVVPGATEFSCRCIKIDFVGRAGDGVVSTPVAQDLPPEPRPKPKPKPKKLTARQQAAADKRTIARPSSAYRPIKGRSVDGTETIERFRRADGSWTPERKRLHDAIVRRHFAGATPVRNPTSNMLGGGPASGKGTAILRNTKFPNNRVTIDPDEIKKLLPEYREGVAARQTAAAGWAHEESSFLAKRIAAQAAGGRYNLLMDGTGDNSFENLTGKIAGFRVRGARVSAHYVTIDTDEAVRRAASRAARSGRAVRESVVVGTHRRISEVVPRVLNEGHFDDFVLWDNNGSSAFRVAEYSDGKLDILDTGAWQRFLDKATP